MEQNLPMVAKKFWNILRVVFFMSRKGLSKRKLLLDLNMMMKRGKIAGKAALKNLKFHGHRHPPPLEYEFSCSNSPAYSAAGHRHFFPFHISKRKLHNHHSNLFSCVHAPPEDEDMATVNAVIKALELLNNSEAASPALPGFGWSPVVRQLRITDSPYPIREVEEDSHVDEAAEEFIAKFYNSLRQQNTMAALGYR